MSFILDALRKSEIERQRQHGPGIAEFATARVDHRQPWALVAIGALLALNVAVILYFLLRDSAPEAGPATVAAPAQSTAPETKAGPPATTTAMVAPATRALPDVDEASGMQSMPADAYEPPSAPDPTLVPAPPQATPSVTYGDEVAPSQEALAARAATGLPELSMDLHIYATDRAKRAVFINGRRYTEGSTIAEGPIVEEITSEGAVLHYRGHRFLLPRL